MTEDFEELEFVIPAYTPETMPFDRLLRYLAEISEVMGVARDMHLIRIEPSSTKPVFKMPTPVAMQARKTERRCRTVKVPSAKGRHINEYAEWWKVIAGKNTPALMIRGE